MSILYRVTQTIWRRQGFWGEVGWLTLAPLSLGFTLLVQGRNLLYDRHWLTAQRPALKVISVGNLTVGGTGKTPVTLWLAQALQSRGHRVGILTRGYGGKNSGLTLVGTTGQALATPDEVGDEPVMLARTFAGVVIAGRNRAAAARLAHEHFGLQVAILDDGFQHRRLERDVDLLLLNRNGSNWVLPAGPLREPVSELRRADVVILTKGGRQAPQRWLAATDTRPVFFADLIPTSLLSPSQQQWQESPLQGLIGRRIMAVSGIADPQPFYRMLRDWDADLAEVLEFPDHHPYTQEDWHRISQASKKCDLIVTTEKDLVKLEPFPFAAGKLVALRVRMEIEQPEQLLVHIEQQLAK
jgi:tetraacyldisaccharide 4'-kinase